MADTKTAPDADTMSLVLIRHGESEWNKLNLFTGRTDVDLTDTGRREAADSGRALAEQGFDFGLLFRPTRSSRSTSPPACRWPTPSTATGT